MSGKKIKSFGFGKMVVWIVVCLLIQWLYYYLIILNLPSWDVRGQFGDLFGGLAAGFNGLTFAGLIYTLLLQREEIRAQQIESSNISYAQRQSNLILSLTGELSALNSMLQSANLEYQFMIKEKYLRDECDNKMVEINEIKHQIQQRLDKITFVKESDNKAD